MSLSFMKINYRVYYIKYESDGDEEGYNLCFEK